MNEDIYQHSHACIHLAAYFRVLVELLGLVYAMRVPWPFVTAFQRHMSNRVVVESCVLQSWLSGRIMTCACSHLCLLT